MGVAAALAVIAAGCTKGTTTIAQRDQLGEVACPIKAGQPSTATYWHPGPGTVRLRFQVLKSDSPVELTIWGSYIPGDNPDLRIPYIARVWDGTTSTGPFEVGWGLANFSSLSLVALVAAPQETHTTWALTALDANGNDVGLTCASSPRYE